MKQIHLPEVGSTNDYMRQLLEDDPKLHKYTIVTTHTQSAGRGQRGNSWETMSGQNLTCSILLRPKLRKGVTSFDLNIAVSLALLDTLSAYIDRRQIHVKWPNDIMVGERKIAGILMENEWIGDKLDFSIAGIGLNVHQTEFDDYRPLATSLALEGAELHKKYDKWHTKLAEELAKSIKQRIKQLKHHHTELRVEYHRNLFAIDEERNFNLPDGTQFLGIIRGVLPNGLLQMDTPLGSYLFAFKEVRMII